MNPPKGPRPRVTPVWPRTFRTATFRLALLYAIIFGLSALTLFAFLRWRLTDYMVDQMRGAISAELSFLAQEGRVKGADELRMLVDARANAADSASSYYLLQDPAGRRLAGNLPAQPAGEGEFNRRLQPLNTARSAEEREGTALLRAQTLSDGSLLFIGRDLKDLDDISKLVNQAILAAVALTAVLAAVGGLALGVGSVRRIEAINQTTARIIAGNLAQRVPIAGVDDEFDRLASNLNRMLDRITGLMETTRQVSNDIAHDLRTPLARLRQRLERAQAKARTLAEYETEVQEAIVEIDGILSTFSALLRIAQVEAGTRSGGFAEVDLSRVFDTIAEAYGPVAEDRGQRIETRIQPGVSVRGDRELLTQMLANLVENAIRHTSQGSFITLELGRTVEGGLVGGVVDTGPGIPADELDKVFRRFYRLERSRTTSGNGLGLSLVAAVAELHGIALDLADNRPGLRVTLRFNAG